MCRIITLLFFVAVFPWNEFAQTSLVDKTYIVLHDSVTVDVNRPVFIFGNELIFRDANTVAASVPIKDVTFISRACHNHRLSNREIDRLSKPYFAKKGTNIALLSFASIAVLVESVYGPFNPANNYSMAAISVGFVVLNKVIVKKRQERNEMIFSTRGIDID
ncbi:MAG: hypothetical protein RJB36_1378 [Bacteroidota bacterium]|jgi:hypothetical protein